MYMMKPNMGPGGMPGFPMGGPDGMGHMGPDMPVMNGNGDSMGDMKNSPHNGPGTPRDDMTPGSGPGGNDMGFNMPPYQDNPGVNPDQTESAAILKIKESMQEEAKRFEKDTPTDPEYFGM